MSEIKIEGQEKASKLSKLEQELQIQKELTLEYFSLLTQAEKQHEDLRQELQAKLQDKEKALAEIQEELRIKDQSLAEVQEELQSQKQLTLRYYHSLAQAEAEQERLRNQIEQMDAENRQLRNWMQGLHKEFQALLASRRWRLGHALGQLAGGLSRRNEKPRSDQRIQKIFARFEHFHSKQPSAAQDESSSCEKSPQLIKWMEKLDKEFQAVMQSRRWRLGNALVNVASRFLLRSRETKGANHMQQIFKEFRDWKKNANLHQLSTHDIRQLQQWIKILEKEFHGLKSCTRLKLGNLLATPVGIIRRQATRPKAIDSMQQIFDQYNSIDLT